MSETGAGALLVLTAGGIRQLVDGAVKPFVLPNMVGEVNALSLLRDRDGAHWIGTTARGLIHVHEGRMDTYARSDGLSGDRVFNMFEDREGNIWATTTDGGIDRFRAFATTTYSSAQGLPSPVYSVVAGGDGSIWLNTSAGLYQWRSGGFRAVIPMRRRSQYSGGGYSLFQDRSDRIWLGGESELGSIENGRFVKVDGMPTGIVQAITQDNKGDLWVAHMKAGILRVSSDRQVHHVPWEKTSEAGRGSYSSMTADPVHGGIWVGLFQTIAHFSDGQVRASYDFADTLGKARITSLRAAADGTLWAASDAGLMRLKAGRVAMLDRAIGLPCDQVDSTIEDNHGSLWLYTPCGIASIPAADLEAWSRSIDAGRAPQRIRAALLDQSDGVRFDATPITGAYAPHIARSVDGKLWFVTFDGVTIVDPRRPALDKRPLPVHIEQIVADRTAYEPSSRVRLPALVRDLQIDYTATSLITPERTLFRYKLEDRDRDWQDAGTRRQAFYNGLSPGNYRFRVIAANKNGVWSEEGATLDFTIAPAYWQTWWFRAFCVVALLIASWSLYRRRMRQLARQFNMTLEARVAERTRIARDLHDTLLQSFHGLLLRFQTALELLPKRPAEARQLLVSAIDQAAEAITEGRDAVQGLRASTTDNNDLAAAIRTLGQELAAGQGGDEILRVEVQGAPRSLHPLLRDEIFRIAGEALRNAFRHAGAKQIEVELRYDAQYLRLRVRDDGKGVDPTVLRQDGREGHFGIRGMRERAALIGGKLTVWSAPDSGTEVELNVRASHAYAASSWAHSRESAEKLNDERMS
jgi:signal transduction histidine kinase